MVRKKLEVVERASSGGVGSSLLTGGREAAAVSGYLDGFLEPRHMSPTDP